LKCKYLNYKAHSPNADSVPHNTLSNSSSLRKIVKFYTSEDQNPQISVYAGINFTTFIYTKSATFPSSAKCRCSDNLETFFSYNLLHLKNRPSRRVLWAKRPPWLALAAMRLNASSRSGWRSQFATGTTADFAIVFVFFSLECFKMAFKLSIYVIFTKKKVAYFQRSGYNN